MQAAKSQTEKWPHCWGHHPKRLEGRKLKAGHRSKPQNGCDEVIDNGELKVNSKASLVGFDRSICDAKESGDYRRNPSPCKYL